MFLHLLCYALYFQLAWLTLFAVRSPTKLTQCNGYSVNFVCDSDSAVRRLHLDQQLAKARSFLKLFSHLRVLLFLKFLSTRRADVEKGLLMEGVELLEPLLSSKLSKVGISKFLVAREWAKVLRAEGVIRINNCFSAATGVWQHSTFLNPILLV